MHCHNDLGLATANTLAGIQAGARQAEVTINGIGERAGNTSLEEVVMALHTRRPIFGLDTGIDTTQITRISRLVSNYTGIPVQPNKAIVGANAFAHEAGIHQDGMLKNQQTYEIMRPRRSASPRAGWCWASTPAGTPSKPACRTWATPWTSEELDQVFERFKQLADKKKTITDADLEALISDELYQPREIFRLDGLQVACGTMGMPTATVRLRGPDGQPARPRRGRHRPGRRRLQSHRRHHPGPQHPAGVHHPRRHRGDRRPRRGDRAHPEPERADHRTTPSRITTSPAPLAATAPTPISSSPAPRPTSPR